MLYPVDFTAFALFAAVQAIPSHQPHLYKRCGPVQEFYNQNQGDWDTYNTTDWLNSWWDGHTDQVSSNTAGFAGAFGQWAMGNPDWSCSDSGSNTDCDLNLCDNRVLNDKGDDIRPAYYVLESVNRLHTYFTGLGEAFTTTALGAALSKDEWALTFYKDKDAKSVTALKEALNAVTTIVDIGATFAGLGPAVGGAVAGAGSALLSGGIAAGNLVLGDHKDDTFEKSADLGSILGTVVVDSLKSFTTANNDLMAGKEHNEADIRSYLSGGVFLDYSGVDKNVVTDSMTAMMIFIMGDGACGDDQGIGSGPQEAVVCRDDRAWYLYYWQENDVVSTTAHQWGWGPYSGISIEDIINSSLDAYNAAGYDYNADKATERASDAVSNAWASLGKKGASCEGVFTIPVCDVGGAVNSDFESKEYILQPYGHDMRPVWCGAICGGDQQTTQIFINAANMGGFKSPKHLCSEDPGY
ncbi:hypothetical protein P170DRAFT_443287 [Aspergillus steynii IBT 23096]|uniref:Uncharacterized protein n=1 Tax=Aspergillus steynii IBT 23096 TaxID=1392250 RepID=A0A2I2GRM0_9EURO|nr:uncharacterized protein P170DRAFT_443287 [Aspergillus steynii IBT 23096]PLB55528.1 hypothetical protein P170DRAFT_443287 [Aspergillus steynii IBT 23096]